MGMHVFSKLKQTLRRKDKPRDADWDFGARQSPPEAAARRRSASVDAERRGQPSSETSDPQTAGPSGNGREQHEQGRQHRRVSAAVDSNLRGSRGNSGTTSDARKCTTAVGGPRTGSPEDNVLLAAGETAKEVRTTKPAEQRRRVHSVAAARLTDLSTRPVLRHAASTLDARLDATDIPLPSSPTTRSAAGSPTPSMQSFRSAQRDHRSRISGKRSMPQLHNVWENFLEEAAEDVDAFAFPLPPQSSSKFATVHVASRTDGSSPLRHHHTPTSSSSSASTTKTAASTSTIAALPRGHPLESSTHQRQRGHMRTSHHTSSSTSSATTASAAGSTSSMAAFSSASSTTTAHDEPDDVSRISDDPVPPLTPRSSTTVSPKDLKFADPPLTHRLRKSPTSPAFQLQFQHQTVPRGVSPTSSMSSDSCVDSTVSLSHSQSTTPTPSSICPTPSPTPCSPKHAGRRSPAVSRNSPQYRRTPDGELRDHQASVKSASNSLRYLSTAGGSKVELVLSPAPEEGKEEPGEMLLEPLGYHTGPTSPRVLVNSRENRQSTISTISTSSTLSSQQTPSASPIVPPLRRSSRQHLRAVVAQSAPSCDSMLLPRAKSASNIRHEANAALERERPRLVGSHSSPPLLSTTRELEAASSDTLEQYSGPGAKEALQPQTMRQARPQLHARSQTLQLNQMRVVTNNNSSFGGTQRLAAAPSPSPSSNSNLTSTSVPGQGQGQGQQGRQRSGSASVVYNHNYNHNYAYGQNHNYNHRNNTYPQIDVKVPPPVRPPPAPPLDMSSARLQLPVPNAATTRRSATPSPLTPASAVQWGYAL